MNLFVHKKIGWPAGMGIVSKEDFSVMELRTVMTVQMKMPVVSNAYIKYTILGIVAINLPMHVTILLIVIM